MSLTQALLSSASGLRTAQAGLALISSNVANVNTPGYARKTLSQISTVAGDVGMGVRVVSVNRQLDLYLQRQLRTEMAGGSYASLRAQFYDRLQTLIGEPGGDGTLETTFNNLTAALEALHTSPDSSAARTNVLSAAQQLTQRLNGMTADVQALRSDAESGLSDAVTAANNAMQQIARINQQLAASGGANDSASAVLMDQRDNYVDQLSQLMDVRVMQGDNNQISVFTNSGVQLVGSSAAKLEFHAAGMLTPNTLYSDDPARRQVGTVMLVSPNGAEMDMLANNSIRSGSIAAYAEMRDRVLPGFQTQLDAIAAAMAQALSDKTTAGTPATAGAQSGFDLDLGGLLPGNSMRVTYTDVTTNTQRTVTFVRVDDPAALPLGDDATADPNDRVFGINFSGGMASVATQVASALGANFTVSNPSGNTLRILDDGGVNTTMNAASTTKTTTGLASGGVELPMFMDGSSPYTGAIAVGGSELIGFAGRISINSALLADPSKLVLYGPGVQAGDTTRASFILEQISQATLTFPSETGIGSTASPYQGSIADFVRQVLSTQGDAAANATALAQGQDVVVNSLKQRAADVMGVNIDEELSNLLQLQSAYAANARVMSAVKDMLDLLSKM